MKTHIQKVIHCSIICSEKTPEYYLNVQIKDISWINYSNHTMQLLKNNEKGIYVICRYFQDDF